MWSLRPVMHERSVEDVVHDIVVHASLKEPFSSSSVLLFALVCVQLLRLLLSWFCRSLLILHDEYPS